MRIAVGGISHETSSFAKVPTRIADFAEGFGLFRGPEVIQRFTGSNICTGGFIEAAETHGFEIVPLLWGFAYPSGLIVREDYEALKQEFLDRLRAAEMEGGPVDGVLLDLHGAMVVEGIDDGDGDFIEAVRRAVGNERPIGVTFDLHSNHTPRRVAAATAIVGFDTFPHVDMAERGREMADLVVRTIRKEISPTMSLHQLPLFWNTPTQITALPPMTDVMERVHELERRKGVLAVTLATGFPWSDVPDVGASVIAVTDGDPALAKAVADELGTWIWEHRERWYHPMKSVGDAIAEGKQIGRYPIVLADHADNTGGGSPGDATEVLITFLERKLTDALILYIVDPEVAQQAHVAGVGAVMTVDVGGKSDPLQGPPVRMTATVKAVSTGDFTYDGPMYAGLTGNMGCSAWLQQDGVSVVVVSAHEQPLGPAFAKSLGIDCPSMKYIAVKSAAHFRASFGKFAGSIFNVDTKAIHTHDFRQLPYQKRTRAVFPVEIPPRETHR
ncbi:M81 family metallopeptidase [Schlesneria sp. DSM 10557]|uniref:M81 family metallopeptidase n=1 Tax=Schlesneria sp. DSM 10557 TaxID=3044399 RepID=UPI0035A1B81D